MYTQSTIANEVSIFNSGIKLHAKFFPATGAAKGNFLLLHGLTSNSSWFTRVAEQLSFNGYNVLVYDRRGSGQSSGVRGDAPGKDAFLTDMKAAADFVWSHSAQPLHIISFSYSWKLSPLFIKKLEGESRKVGSLIFVAPASDVSPNIKPKFSDLMKIVFNWKGPYFESPVKENHLTQESETLNFIRDAEKSKVQLKFTRRFLLTSKKMDNEAARVLPELKKPMLVLLPKTDRVIDHAKVRDRFSKGPQGFPRKIIDIDGGHLVDSPLSQKQLVEQVLQWVNKSAVYS